MKIIVITGSPHRNGTTFLLTDEWIKGAESQGHEVIRFDAGLHPVHPCTGCDHCRSHEGKCVFDDLMTQILPALLSADLVLLSTPLYYFGFSAQIKAVLDRFYAVNEEVIAKPLKAMLLAAGGDSDDWAMGALEHHYETVCRYLHWQDTGRLLALGLNTREDAETSSYPQQARLLGASIH